MLPQTRNVTRAFRAATDSDKAEGKVWYQVAHNLAAMLDDDTQRGAAVIAALSPITSWEQNVRLAQDAYAGRPVKALGPNVRKATAILSGTDPATVIRPSRRAQKVFNFWQLIADPQNDTAVCVDRHAYDVAVGRVTDDETRSAFLRKVGNYERIAQCYRNAARVISRETGEHWTPAQIQAVTWVYWRNTKVRNRSANVREAA